MRAVWARSGGDRRLPGDHHALSDRPDAASCPPGLLAELHRGRRRHRDRHQRRLVAIDASGLATRRADGSPHGPFVTLLVMAAGSLIEGEVAGLPPHLSLLWQVSVIAAPVMAVRALIWRPLQTIIETRTIVLPPTPAAESAFRQRLSAKRRAARLIAIEAYDHYLRVHTDAGCELLTLRFSDALLDLQAAMATRPIAPGGWPATPSNPPIGKGDRRSPVDRRRDRAGQPPPRRRAPVGWLALIWRRA